MIAKIESDSHIKNDVPAEATDAMLVSFIEPNIGIGTLKLGEPLATPPFLELPPANLPKEIALLKTQSQFQFLAESKFYHDPSSQTVAVVKDDKIVLIMTLNPNFRTSIGDISVGEEQLAAERLPEDYLQKKPVIKSGKPGKQTYLYHGMAIFTNRVKKKSPGQVTAIAVFSE
jgi:hypothetical protein